jgi:PPM family protein phosphatase
MASDARKRCCSVEHAEVTDVGMRRANNQDSYVVSLAGGAAHWQERGHLFCVADGMGAHAAGELASKLAVDNVPHNYDKLSQLPPPHAILEAIRETNGTIYSRGQGSVDFHGMGTTCTTLLLLPYGAVIAHVGDSRAYRLRGTTLEQLTFDHSLVWEMAEAGSVSERDIPPYVPKNVITRSLGPHENVSVDLEGPFPVEPGDVFLLCSDGLTGPVSDEEIGIMLSCLPPAEAAQTLVDVANLRGGPDNITALVVQVNEELSSATAEAEPPAERTEEDTLPPPPPPAHPLVWVMISASSVAGLIFLAMQMWVPAGVAGGVLGVAILALIISRFSRGGRVDGEMTPLGRGPYRSYECPPDEEAVASLLKLLAELRIVAVEQGWEIDWGEIDAISGEAQQAREEGDFRTAVAKHATAVRLLMEQIRQQRESPLSDSKIGL